MYLSWKEYLEDIWKEEAIYRLKDPSVPHIQADQLHF